VPTQDEEQQRLEARHRRALSQPLQSLRARGRGLLLSQGVFQNQSWWTRLVWADLKPKLCAPLQRVLEDLRAQMQVVEEQLEAVEKTLEAAAPKELPKGFGRLTFVLLLRELCNYRRFAHRRKVGGFTGLCGAVSSSGPCHLDMGINKAGSPYVRTLLIELAWRMVYWQSQYKALTKWQLLRDAGQLKNRRRRKIALVALARQLAVDIWRWQTGQVTPQALGWQMSTDD
jgi:transposase